MTTDPVVKERSRRQRSWQLPGGRTVPIVHQRHIWRWVSGAAVIAVLMIVVVIFARAPVNYRETLAYLVDPRIISGAGVTMLMTIISMAIAIGLGLVAAVMKASPNPVASRTADLYIWFFRGTPQLVQLIIFFNLALLIPKLGVPGVFEISTNSIMSPFRAAVLALGINEGAYMAEIFRSGLLAINIGQFEAAQGLGMRRGQLMRLVILPQAMRVVIPPTGNEFILMLKVTSLAYVISVSELLGSANKIYSQNFQIMELLLAVSVWYLALTTILSFFQTLLEKRVGRGFRRPSAGLGFARGRG